MGRRRAAERSVTLVKGADRLPLESDQPVLVVWPELRHRTEVDEPAVHQYTLADALQPLHGQVLLAVIGTQPDNEEIAAVLERSQEVDQIVVATYTAEGSIPEGQQSLVRQLQQLSGKRVIVVSTRNPYDLNAFSEIETYLCLYENRPFSLDAAAQVLVGELQPQGVLPVSLIQA
nr:glycoside hydrolase family 3 C-terminal domain-containing protein [Paenibacillus rubinfantis]